MSNLGQIRTVARAKISQTDTTNTDFTNDELNSFINEGQRFLAAIVKKPLDHVEAQAQEGYPAYPLPQDAILLLIASFGVTSTGDALPIRIITEEQLREVAPGYLNENASSYGRPQYVCLLDAHTVLVWPTPSAAESVSGKKIHLSYVYQPSNLVNDSDTPDLPLVYHDLLAAYTQHLCYMSKLKQPELGVAILDQIEKTAKKLEPVIIKESNNPGWVWGRSIDPNDDGFIGNVRP